MRFEPSPNNATQKCAIFSRDPRERSLRSRLKTVVHVARPIGGCVGTRLVENCPQSMDHSTINCQNGYVNTGLWSASLAGNLQRLPRLQCSDQRSRNCRLKSQNTTASLCATSRTCRPLLVVACCSSFSGLAPSWHVWTPGGDVVITRLNDRITKAKTASPVTGPF
jgi:hypothetical protein